MLMNLHPTLGIACIHIYIYMNIYIYVYVCVCVCVNSNRIQDVRRDAVYKVHIHQL